MRNFIIFCVVIFVTSLFGVIQANTDIFPIITDFWPVLICGILIISIGSCLEICFGHTFKKIACSFVYGVFLIPFTIFSINIVNLMKYLSPTVDDVLLCVLILACGMYISFICVVAIGIYFCCYCDLKKHFQNR